MRLPFFRKRGCRCRKKPQPRAVAFPFELHEERCPLSDCDGWRLIRTPDGYRWAWADD